MSDSIQESPGQCLTSNLDGNLLTQARNIPAAIVSPPLRIKILPMSLFDEKGSRGIPFEDPAVPVLRSEISTSAEAFFAKTLRAYSQQMRPNNLKV